MPRLRNLIIVLAFFSTSSLLSAQSSANISNEFVAKGFSLTEITDQDWSFYSDEENQIYYIDFEKITFNLNEIVVFDDQQNVVFKEEVFDLPVNTIYELDLKPYGKGEFFIEIRSFTNFIKKEVKVL
jgi:hypothetical protein